MPALSSIKALLNVVKLWDRVSELAERASVLEARLEHLEGRGGFPAFLERFDVHHTEAGDTVYRSTGAAPPHYICPRCAADRKRSLLQKQGHLLRCPACPRIFDITRTPRM